jgi:DNA-binding GntR family transcriptional regulator
MNDIALLESQIDEYIASHGLEHGSVLPPVRDLAAELACDEDALVKAIRVAEKKRKVTYNQGARVAKLTDYHDRFSFTKSAESHKRKLTTELIEKNIRLPIGDSDDPFFEVERQAQEVLGIRSNKKFLIISRVRLLDGQPSVFQRAYLNPARFPKKSSLLTTLRRNRSSRCTSSTVTNWSPAIRR